MNIYNRIFKNIRHIDESSIKIPEYSIVYSIPMLSAIIPPITGDIRPNDIAPHINATIVDFIFSDSLFLGVAISSPKDTNIVCNENSNIPIIIKITGIKGIDKNCKSVA